VTREKTTPTVPAEVSTSNLYLIRRPRFREGVDSKAAIGGITPDGRLYLQVHEQAFRSDSVVHFLEHPLCHVPGKLLIV
jgi:hypothetical protein